MLKSTFEMNGVKQFLNFIKKLSFPWKQRLIGVTTMVAVLRYASKQSRELVECFLSFQKVNRSGDMDYTVFSRNFRLLLLLHQKH